MFPFLANLKHFNCNFYYLTFYKFNLGGGCVHTKDLNPSCPNFVDFLDMAGPKSSKFRLLTFAHSPKLMQDETL